MHGGAPPNAHRGKANGNYRHGHFTHEALQHRRMSNGLIRLLRHIAAKV